MEEIKGIVFSLAHNKSPGPDGFPGEFYQFFWEKIKNSLKRLSMLSLMEAWRLVD
jgi:hypothetical protein